MSDSIKSISLDDIVDVLNPLGMNGPSDKTRNKALHYSPQYGDLADTPLPTASLRPSEDTLRREEKFSFGTTMTRFSEILGPISGGGSKKNQIIAAGIIVIVVFALAFLYFGSDFSGGSKSPVDSAPIGRASPGLKEGKPKLRLTEKKSTAVATQEAQKADEIQTSPTVVEAIPGNPYWKLPNPIASVAETSTPISAQDIEKGRAGLSHPFNYQRYKAIEDMRKNRMDGSVAILYEALSQPKFWARMEALLSIAEQGVGIDNESMKVAIGNARSDLVRNYFRRFRSNYTEATSHILREALRVVDGKTRLVILQQLAEHRNETNDMYLIAGISDEDSKVKVFAQEALSTHPALPSIQETYAKAQSEKVILMNQPQLKKPVVAQDIKVEKMPANLNVEEVYFVNDEEAPAEETPKDAKKDDGFNDLEHRDHEQEAIAVPVK